MNSKSEEMEMENGNVNGNGDLRNKFDFTDEAQERIIKMFRDICNILPFTKKENRFNASSFLFVVFCFCFDFWRISFVKISPDSNDIEHSKKFLLIIGLWNVFLCVLKLIMSIRQEYLVILILIFVSSIAQIIGLLILYFDFNERNYKEEKEFEYVYGFIDFCFMFVVFFNMIFHNPQKQQPTTTTTEPKEIEKND